MEALVILLDVGVGMYSGSGSTNTLEGAVEAVTLLVQQKILFKPKDQVGMILFGSKETNNNLDYENISVEQEISRPDTEFLKNIQAIEPGEEEGDFVDALIIGMDMLVAYINESTSKNPPSPRLFLITNAAAPANSESLEIVLDQVQKMGAQLNIIGIDFTEEEELKGQTEITSIKKKNEKLLYQVAEAVEGVVLSLPKAVEVMGYFRSTSVLQRPTFNGYLEISDLKIRVKSFIKTKKASFPAKKKTSIPATEIEDAESTDVVQERTYHSIDDLDNPIEKSETVKGYKYGRSLVPISAIDELVLKYTCDSCMKLIGFTKASNIPRHHYLGNSEVVAPFDGDDEANTAISALVRAMLETESVGIVRYCPRKNSIKLAVLQPHVTADSDFFYLHQLPYAEDLRHFPFPPLDPKRARPSIIPTAEQLDAVDHLIDLLDLSEAGEDEDGETMQLLKPKHTFNPSLQYFYKSLHSKAINPTLPLPGLPSSITDYVNPPKLLFANAEKAMENIEELFPLEIAETKKKVKTRYWADATVDELRLESYAVDDAAKKKSDDSLLSLDTIIAGGVSDVGSIDPVKDFEEMIKRRDVDLVDKAIDQLKDRVTQLLNDSVKDQLYPKALACVHALRKGCVQEEEPAAFNTFLRLLRSMYERKRHDAFWNIIAEAKISLIHEEECEESDITPEESAVFLDVKEPEKVEVSSVAPDDDDVDDLFDMIE